MIRKRILVFPAAVLAFASALLASAESFAEGKPAGTAPSPARVTMEELKIRGREQLPLRMFLPPVEDMFHRSPVRFDLFREDLATPIPLSDLGHERQRTGGYLADDE